VTIHLPAGIRGRPRAARYRALTQCAAALRLLMAQHIQGMGVFGA